MTEFPFSLPFHRNDAFDAIVLGTSAGGVRALGELLPALPDDFAPSLLIVVHVPPDTKSPLAKLFADRCRIPIFEAEDKQPVKPGEVLFAPAGYHMQVEDDRTIALSLDPPEHFSRPSIDVLFESAAWVYRSRLLGILLTGANEDGAAGLEFIKNAGGHAWVQEPGSAQSDAMPMSALRRGVAAEILTLAEVRRRLIGMTRRIPRGVPNTNN